MRTLRKFIGMAAGLAVIAMAGAAMAQTDDVSATKHNLSTSGTGAVHVSAGGGTDEVCVFCHTPHAASTTAKPLWNREDSAAAYQMYNNAWSSTIDMTVAGSPQGVSLACLSCHDGTVALDAFQNAPGAGGGGAGSEGYTFTGADPGNLFPAASFAMLGPDLRNDHPISVTYDIVADPSFNAAGTFTNVQLANGNVECSSCHNPHDADGPLNDTATFLRGDNAGSALCLECHIK